MDTSSNNQQTVSSTDQKPAKKQDLGFLLFSGFMYIAGLMILFLLIQGDLYWLFNSLQIPKSWIDWSNVSGSVQVNRWGLVLQGLGLASGILPAFDPGKTHGFFKKININIKKARPVYAWWTVDSNTSPTWVEEALGISILITVVNLFLLLTFSPLVQGVSNATDCFRMIFVLMISMAFGIFVPYSLEILTFVAGNILAWFTRGNFIRNLTLVTFPLTVIGTILQFASTF